MLCFENVRKTYGDLVALEGLNLRAAAGEILGLLGPNGAGKTTAVSIACGLLRPDSGTIRVGDFGPPTSAVSRRRVGLAPQALALYEELTGEENLLFFGRVAGMGGRRLRERVRWALDFAGLTERARGRVSTYSGGMARRLNLAAALVHDPLVILLDEPTVGVDPQSRASILERVQALAEQGAAVMYTTHYMEEAQRICDRVGIIDHGRLLALDTVDALIAAHGGRSVVAAELADGQSVRIETDDPMDEIARLVDSGATRLSVDRPDLESVFLGLTGRSLRD